MRGIKLTLMPPIRAPLRDPTVLVNLTRYFCSLPLGTYTVLSSSGITVLPKPNLVELIGNGILSPFLSTPKSVISTERVAGFGPVTVYSKKADSPFFKFTFLTYVLRTVLYSPKPGPPTSITRGGEINVNLSISVRGLAACEEMGRRIVSARAKKKDKATNFLVAIFEKNCTHIPFMKLKESHSRT